MTDIAATPEKGVSAPLVRFAPVLFGVTVFTSASLVFLVEPMMAKLVLPTLGGSPAVWNTSMAFFQVALLVGYLYAHLLQRIRSLKVQTAIHAAVLLVAALALPLRVTHLFGDLPTGRFPIGWLVGVLTVSLGAPFAALSATAPLAQAWYARVRQGHADAANPYVLYVASNLGSLIALVAYPAIVEPALKLSVQTLAWSVGYGGFLILMLFVAAVSRRRGAADFPVEVAEPPLAEPGADAARLPVVAAARITPWERLVWVALAAIPSSLMLGVTNYITTDIASAPFLWVAPLALYLLTFIIAFSNRPLIPPYWTLLFQGAAIAGLAWTLGSRPKLMLLGVAVHLVGFFLTALMCHQALAKGRPDPRHLTEFYLWMSVGGVIGGGFNAFLAPLLFPGVWEYPIVLVLSCFARPWGTGRLGPLETLQAMVSFDPQPRERPYWVTVLFALGVICAGVAVSVSQAWGYGVIQTPKDPFLAKMLELGPRMLFTATPICAFLIRDRALFFAGLILTITIGSHNLVLHENLIGQARSFFGVMRVTQMPLPGYADKVLLLAHGTTLHGAQAMDSANPCRPMTYYAPETPIGQVFLRTGEAKRNMVVGAVGMGSGSIAAYARHDDEYRFYEIDPTVVAISATGQFFTYISKCAKAEHLDWRIGDARLTLAKEKNAVFDVLLVDAFSSDAVPAHLLTVEAMKMYLAKIRPDGVVIMHLSNRNLDLKRPVAAVAEAAGGYALAQYYEPPNIRFDLVQSAEDVIIVGRSKQALEAYRNDWRWQPPSSGGVRPWTDDYTNTMSAMIRRLQDRYAKPETRPAGGPY